MRLGLNLGIPMMGGGDPSVMAIKGLGGLAFHKNYLDGLINANYALGSRMGIFSCSRSASNPQSWIDGNGRINVSTTSDVPLFSEGYYDETGFHAKRMGIICEPASTNLLTRTDGTAYADGLWTGWDIVVIGTSAVTKSNVLVSDLINIADSRSQRLQRVLSGETNKNAYVDSPLTAIGSVSAGDVLTFSVLLRSQTENTGIEYINFYGYTTDASNNTVQISTNYNVLSLLSTGWRKFTLTMTCSGATTSRARLALDVRSSASGSSVDLEIALPQIEKGSKATSRIPTSTTPLTRNASTLKYENAGNSTAEEETILIKFTPYSTFANDGISRPLYSTDTKERLIRSTPSGDKVTSYANSTDSISSAAATTTTPLLNTTAVICAVFKHSSPYVKVYYNGSAQGTDVADDFTNPAWGTYFGVGYSTSGSLSGTIASVTKFSRALSDAEVLTVSQILGI